MCIRDRFQIVAALAGNQGFADAAGFQGGQIVFGAVNLVCLIQLLSLIHI